jgi:membrane-associated phospholipid phosphatase
LQSLVARRRLLPLFALLLCQPAHSAGTDAEGPDPAASAPPPAHAGKTGLVADIKDYFTAPLHWSWGDWATFGGVLVAIGAAHHYDSQVRNHFVAANPDTSSRDLQDALPTAAVLGATWAYAALLDSEAGRSETWDMVEAAGLGSVTAYAVKFAAGRQGPDQTSDPNEWGKGQGSFPSWHTTAAFAVGTVLAESGNDEFRWVRRVIGYGLGSITAYERLKHNAHWLSDVVAGAALGAASAHFVLVRRNEADGALRGHVDVTAAPGGGVMLTYTRSFE